MVEHLELAEFLPFDSAIGSTDGTASIDPL
jgi:hypothetical protein